MSLNSPRKNRRAARFHRPLVELLEDRCLLTATVSESFDYVADEPLHGQNGGAGFSDAWFDNELGQSNAVAVAAGSLAYPGLSAEGNRVLVSSTGFIDRPLEDQLGTPETTRYFSFLMRPESAIQPDVSVGLGIRGGTDIFVGKPSVGENSAYVLEAFGGAGQISSGKTAVQGETVLLVVRADFGPGNDTLRLYVNPIVGQPEPAIADATLSAFDVGTLYALEVNSANNLDMAASIDEIRVGSTFADVTPAAIVPHNTPPSNVQLDAPSALVNEGDTYTLTGSFTDPDDGQTHTVFIDWGDGSDPDDDGQVGQSVALDAGTPDIDVVGFTVPHQYLNNPAGEATGIFTIQVIVTDSAGASSTDSGATAGLVSRYLLDDDASDSVGDNDGTAFGVDFVLEPATFNPADGSYIDIANAQGLDNQTFTLMAWARPDGPSANNDSFGGPILTKDRAGAGGTTGLWWSAQSNQFGFPFSIDNQIRFITSTPTFPAGTLHLVTGTYDGITFRLYVDGALEAVEQHPGAILQYDASVPWTIGSESVAYRDIGFPRTFDGLIDEVRVYSRALDAEEVLAIYNGMDAGSPATTTVTVRNVAPTVTSAGDQSGFLPGVNAAINLGAFTDPGADSPWTVEVNWGEPNVLPESFEVESPGSLGTRGHTYAAPGVYPVTVTVTDQDDAADSATFQVLIGLQVLNTNDSGFGSLRQAILDANSLTGLDTITFNIPHDDGQHFYYQDDGIAGQVSLAQIAATTADDDALLADDIDPDWPHSWWSIQPASALPLINDRVTIDGATQGAGTPLAAVANSNGPGLGINAVLRVELAGNGLAANGLSFVGGGSAFATGSTVRGLVINGFGLRGIRSNGGGNTIQGNFLGTDPSGAVAKANSRGGILLTISHFNYIGTDGNGFEDAAERNLISGNGGADFGSAIQVQSSADNIIAGNFIGIDRSGAKALGNFAAAITLFANGTNRNRIGTDGNGLADDLERNIISASHGSLGSNQPWGVQLVTGVTNNVVAGNFIGTDVTGTQALGNGNWGLLIANASNNRVGIDPNHVNFSAERNVISGNALGGVALGLNASGNTIWGNYLGTQADGASPLGNVGFGVGIGSGASNNQLGGPGAKANVVAFNTGPGVSLAHQTIALGASAPTLDNPPATGNVTRGNVLHSNGALGIDLGATFNFNTYVSAWDGPTPNDSGDADDGPNRFQNFPSLQAARAGLVTRVIGSFNSSPLAVFTLDFYASAATSFGADGIAEGQRYLGSGQVTTDALGNVSFDTANFSVPLAASVIGEWITATATDTANNTSEFSQAEQAQGLVVTTTANNDFGSLRQVILAANQIPGKDTITFAIPTTDAGYNSVTGAFTIRPTSALPTIADAVILDATTQPGYVGTPMIELDGSAAGSGSDGLVITAGDSSVRGFVINRFASGAGVRIAGQGNVHVAGNYIGTNVAGTDLPAGPLIHAYEFNGNYADALGGPAITPVGGTLNAGNYMWTAVPGNNQGLTLSNTLTTGDNYSIEMVFRFAELTSYHRIIDFKNRVSDTGFYASGTALDFYNVAHGPSGAFTANTYAHVVLTRDAATSQVAGYVNGVQQFGFIDDDNLATFSATGNIIHFFMDNLGSAPNEIASGAVDRIRIYNRALTQTEVSTVLGGGSIGGAGRTNRFGVRIDNVADNIIGTNGDGSADAAERNVISGNVYGVYISGAGARDNRIAGNYIGTNAAGTLRLSNSYFPEGGVEIESGAANNIIGTNGDGLADLDERNIISGLGHAIGISNGSGNVVAGNFVGTNATGAYAIRNGWGVVIQSGAAGNRVGTDGNGRADAAEANLISGNSVGLSIHGGEATGNVVAGNLIGTNATGTAPVGNELGVYISGNAFGNLIGTNSDGNADTAERNVISGNGAGIQIGDGSNVGQTNNNVVAGNFIGTDVSGVAALANTVGVLIQNGIGNRVGTDADGIHDDAERNVISGNSEHGVHIFGPGATGNVVAGNFIGTNAAGDAALPNSLHGVYIDNSTGNLIGGSASAAGNVISGNTGDGINITSVPTPAGLVSWWRADNNATDRLGANPGTLRNGAILAPSFAGGQAFSLDGIDDYVEIPDAPDLNPTTGVTVDAWINLSALPPDDGTGGWDVMSKDNPASGPYVLRAMSDGSVSFFVLTDVEGNFGPFWHVNSGPGKVTPGVFAHVAGTYDAATGTMAVYVNGQGATISAAGTLTTNTNTLKIGADLYNERYFAGLIDEPAVYSRALTPYEVQHIYAVGGAAKGGNVIQGNLIGTDKTGTLAIGNLVGVHVLFGAGNVIGTNGDGSADDAEGNVISANDYAVAIYQGSGNVIAGNSIGTDATGAPLGNLQEGVLLYGSSASGNRVGANFDGMADDLEGNVISANGRFGVRVFLDGAVANSIRGNSIFGNDGLGIDLGVGGVTPNDPGDFDGGPNHSQNFPELASAIFSVGSTTITGTFSSRPDAAFILDFYANLAPDQPDGHGEGQTYVGSMSVTTDADGNAIFATAFPDMLVGKYITATATDAGNNTSEFSQAVRVVSVVSAALTASANPIVFGESVTFHAAVSANTEGVGTPTGQVQLLENGQIVDTATLVEGEASFVISNLAVGTRPFTINYLGDDDFLPGSGPSPALSMTINQANSTLALSSSATNNTSPFGQPVTFTAMVHAVAPSTGTPTGTVVFYDVVVSNVLGSSPVQVINGVNRAVFTTASLTVGQHTILATYVGDANFLASGASLTQTIEADPNSPKQLLVTSAADPAALTLGTLRHALSIANADAANGISDTILFDTTLMGTQTITLQQGQLDLGRAGTGTVSIDGAGQVAISGGGVSRVFRVSNGAHVLVNGLTVQSGSANGGGGIRIEDNATLTVSNTTLTGNSASGGGGGGLWNVGTLTVSNSTIAFNAATGNSSGGSFGGHNYIYPVAGGGIWNHGSLTVVNSTIAGNTAAGKVNVGAPSGGGLWSNGEAIISSSTISGNSASDGGGLFSGATAALALQNTIVAGNTAPTAPDANARAAGTSNYNLIGIGAGLTGLVNNDVTFNQIGTSSAPLNARLAPLAANGGSTLTFALLSDSPAFLQGGPSSALRAAITPTATTIDLANAAVIARTPGSYLIRVDNEQMLVTGVTANTLTVTRGYGGTTAASHVLGSSVFLAADQRGVQRGSPSDIGSYQTPIPSITTFTVTSAADTLAPGTLRDALAKVNALTARGIAGTINFDVGQMGSDTIVLGHGQLALLGSGGGLTTIDGGGRVTIDGANASRVFWIGPGTRAVITGMTIQGGRATGDTFTYDGSGGGIFNLGSLTLANSTLRGNSTFNGGGGGIFNLGTLTVTTSTFSDNSATGRRFGTASSEQETGAIWPISGGAIWNGGALTITNSTLAHNFAKGSPITASNPGQARGGGIFNSATLSITSSTISTNRAEVENPAGQASGGGLFGSVTLQNTIVAGNLAPTNPDISAQATGGHNLIGNGAGLTGIANNSNFNRVGIDPRLVPFDFYAAPTQTFALLPDSPAIRAGGAATTLALPVDASAPTLKVALSRAIASTPGSYFIRIDTEQMLVTNVQGSDTLTVLRGQNGTTATPHLAGAGIFLVTDQGGAARSNPPHIGADETQLLLGAVAGRNFNVLLTAPEGLFPTIFTLSSGSLPIGMSITPDGVLRGTATRTGRYSFRVGYVSDLGAGTQNYVLVVEPGPAAQFFVNPLQSNVTAGVPFNVQLTAFDEFGNLVPNYSISTVAFIQYNYNPGNNSPVTLTSLTWTNGVGTATVIVQKATVTPTNPFDVATLIVSAGSVTGSGGTLTINPGPVSKFGFIISSSARAGDSIQFVLSAEDQFGNRVIPGYSTPQVTFTRSDGAVLIRDSMGPWSASLANVTIRTFKASAVTLIATAGAITGSKTITITPLAAVALKVIAPETVFVNQAFGAEVRALDPYDNIDTSYSASVKLYALTSAPALSLGNVNLANGTVSTSITLNALGWYNLIAVNNSGPQLQGMNTFVTVLAPLIVPAYNSLPGAPASLYLDFDGHFESSWRQRQGNTTFIFSNVTTPAYDMDGDPTTFTGGELANILAIWRQVAEDYAPFRINVTTVDPGDFSNGKALRVAIGGNGAWYIFAPPNSGGVASINGFTDSGSNTQFVFSLNLGSRNFGPAKYVAEAASHEAGHGFGLTHQRDFSTNPVTEYYAGPGDGRAPIMGNSYGATRGLWWNGTSLTATTLQDDMAVLSRFENGFGYRFDEAGDSAGAAAPLTVSGNNVSGAGIITRTTDLDYWSFTTGAGFVSFTVSVPEGINNLDARVALTNSSGALVTAWQDPTFGFGATVSATLPAGSYRLVVASHGGYGDVGQYMIVGTRAGAGLQAVDLPSVAIGPGQILTPEQLRLIVAQAIAHWAAAGVDPQRLAALNTFDVRIADLPGSHLGLSFPDAIWIDADAAGFGWSLDADGVAPDRMDLLTVVAHELGHAMGLIHDEDAHSVMSATLEPGERWLPDTRRNPSLPAAPFVGATDSASEVGVADNRMTALDIPFQTLDLWPTPLALLIWRTRRIEKKWNHPLEPSTIFDDGAASVPQELADALHDAVIRALLASENWPDLFDSKKDATPAP